MSTPHLDQVVPDGPIRKRVYQAFAAIGIILGGTQVGFAAAGGEQPVALTVALAVYGFAAAAGFAKAQANTPTQ